MDGELWNGLYRALRHVCKTHHDPTGVVFGDGRIVEVFLWAALHDRPVSWAVQARHWPAHRRGTPLPSNATMSRRLRSLRVLQLLEALEDYLRLLVPACWLCWCLDAMPLPVGGHSKDRDARWGRAAKGQAKGYKLFPVLSGAQVLAWKIGPMNEGETQAAADLLPRAAQRADGAYVLGDCQYDSNALFEQVRSQGQRLLASRKKRGTGLGHRPHDPDRLRAIGSLESGDPFTCDLYDQRIRIEQYFGNASTFGGGLGPLPRFVRRPRRVARWVHAKLLINYVRIAGLERRRNAAA